MQQLVPEQWRLKAHEVAHAVDDLVYGNRSMVFLFAIPYFHNDVRMP